MPFGVSANTDLCVGVTTRQEPCHWNRAFAIVWSKSRLPLHDCGMITVAATTVSWSRAEVRSPFMHPHSTTTMKWKENHHGTTCQEAAWQSLFPSAGSQIRPNRRRLARFCCLLWLINIHRVEMFAAFEEQLTDRAENEEIQDFYRSFPSSIFITAASFQIWDNYYRKIT